MFVHGVSPSFLEVGRKKAEQARMAQAQAAAAEGGGGAAGKGRADAPDPAAAADAAAAASSASRASLVRTGARQARRGGGGAGGSKPGAEPSAHAAAATTTTPNDTTTTNPTDPVWPRGAYFLGKVLWAKGYTELLDRLGEHAEQTGERVPVDVFGSGPDLGSVREEAVARGLPLEFHGARDHADAGLQEYRVFVNPSLSDVVATTTAEALAMGKWAVVAEHPSNAFFAQFPNCLTYRTPQEFSDKLQHALKEPPQPLTDEQLSRLTWEAATERFLTVAEVTDPPPPAEAALDAALAAAHQALTGLEPLRVLAGAGVGTRETPARVTDYVPRADGEDIGWFDDASRAQRARIGGGGGGGVEGKVPPPSQAAAAAAATPAPAASTLAASAASGPPSHPVPSPRRQQRTSQQAAAAAAAAASAAAQGPAASVAAALHAAAQEERGKRV